MTPRPTRHRLGGGLPRPATSRRAALAVTVLGLLLAVLPVGTGGPAAQAAPNPTAPGSADPLRVSIDSVTPSTLPTSGDIVVSGRITNTSEETWQSLQVYLLTSSVPITTESGLAEAAASDPLTEIGERIVDQGLFISVPDLAPGDSTAYTLRLPRAELNISGAPGVYWLGVHVLGATEEAGRIEGADGRARTFIPLVPEETPATEVALGLQFRQHVVRSPTGELVRLPAWERSFSRGGRLERLLGFSRRAGDFPLAWVVDPSLLEVAESVMAGNPAISMAATTGRSPAEQGSDTAGESARTPPAELPPEARAASRWLRSFSEGAGRRTVLALPYADLDLNAIASAGNNTLAQRGYAHTAQVLTGHGVSARRVAAPLSGYLSPEAFGSLDEDIAALVSPAAVPSLADDAGGADSTDAASGRGGLVGRRPNSGRVVTVPLPSQALVGPAPGARASALAVRQRLLAEAALHALSPDADLPLVFLLPPRWNPGARWQRAAFFTGIRQPWLRPVPMGRVIDRGVDVPRLDPREDVAYPDRAAQAEVPAVLVLTAQTVFEETTTLRQLILDEAPATDALQRSALLGPSVWSRSHPGVATARERAIQALVESYLDQVAVRGPSFVTMSSEDGSFPVTVVNGLDQRVSVGLRMSVTGGALTLVAPSQVELPPGGRQTLAIEARTTDIGIHQVTVQPMTAGGRLVGEPTTFSVRSSKVGLIVWVIMGVGGALFVLAIVLRLVRRSRARRARGHVAAPGTVG